MAYDYHIGVDYHKAYSHIVVQDGSGKTLRSGRVRNDRCSVARFLSRYSDNAHAVLVATRNWTVMFDWLDELCDEVKLAHRWCQSNANSSPGVASRAGKNKPRRRGSSNRPGRQSVGLYIDPC